MAEVRFQSKPRFSLNKLAEYAATASAAKRRRIVLDQANQQAILAARYRVARSSIVHAVLNNALTEPWCTMEEARIRTLFNGRSWNANDLSLSILAIRSAVRHAALFEVKNGKWAAPGPGIGDMYLGKLKVSVRPDLLLMDRTGERTIGALKLIFSKTRDVPAQEGAYGAALMAEFLHTQKDVPRSVRAQVRVIDLLHGRMHVSPAGSQRRLRDLMASADEIVDMWPTGPGVAAA